MKLPGLSKLLASRRVKAAAAPRRLEGDAERYAFDCEGREAVIETPPPGASGVPSALAFSLHKSGSTLLQKILIDLAPHAGVSMCSFDSQFWDQGVTPAEHPASLAQLFRPTGYCYGVFRVFPWRFEIPILATAPKVLLVRDPRDAIVSHYFSIAQSHPAPRSAPEDVRARMAAERQRVNATTIDEHVLQGAEFFRRTHWRYIRDLVRAHNVKVYRYEDIIFEKRAWVDDICRELGWDVPEPTRREVADRHDQRPDAEDPSAHIRRVTPGDHREKLRPETIAQLDEILAAPLDQYGYPRSQPAAQPARAG